MANIGTLTAHIGMDTSRLQADQRRANTMFSGMTGTVRMLSGALAGLGAALGAISIFRKITQTGVRFEQTMTTVAGVMRATAEESQRLTAAARKMGETTEWTASQAGDALQFLGMAGFEANKAIKALPGTLDLATAGQIDLGRAADIATNALTAMGLPVEQLTRVNDVFVGTITRSNTNMEMMAESFKYAAPVARAYGYTIEELAAMIGALGNAGIQGSMAGTQLAMAIQKTNEVAKDFDLEGGKFVDILEQARAKGYDATQIIDAFGLRAGRAAGVLYETTGELRDFHQTLTDVSGEATILADKMRNTIGGSFKELKSVIESVGLDVFDRYRDDLRNLVVDTTRWIRENKDRFVEFADKITKGMGAIIEVIKSIGSALTSAEKSWTTFFDHVENRANQTAIAVQRSGDEIRLALVPPSKTPWDEYISFLETTSQQIGSIFQYIEQVGSQTFAAIAGHAVIAIEGIYEGFIALGQAIQATLTGDFKEAIRIMDEANMNLLRKWGQNWGALVDSWGDAWNTMVDNLKMPEWMKRIGAAYTEALQGVTGPMPFIGPLPLSAGAGGARGGEDRDRLTGGIGATYEIPETAYESLEEYLDRLNEWTSEFRDIQSNRYQWLYEHEQISMDDYISFLKWRLEKTKEYSDEWIMIQSAIDQVQQSAAQKQREEWARTHKFAIQWYTDLGNIAGNVFKDIFNENKSLADSMINVWKSFMSSVVNILADMLAKFVATSLLELARHTATEKAKTAVTRAEAAKRAAIETGTKAAGFLGIFGLFLGEGGLINMQGGGLLRGGIPGKDSIPIMGEPGEYMMPGPAVKEIGTPAFEYLRKEKELPGEEGNVINIDMGGFFFQRADRIDRLRIPWEIEDVVVSAVKSAIRKGKLEL